MTNTKTGKIICVMFFIFLFINFVNAENNMSVQQQAELCLNESRSILNELIENGFSYERVNDSLTKAQSIYDAQIILLQGGKNVDFSLIIPYCEEIKKIKELAFEASDSYSSLKKFYNISITPGMNTSTIDLIFAEIEDEMNSERYEKIPPLVDSAYEEISNVKSSYTALNLFYSATTRGLKKFFQKNGLTVLILTFVLLLLFLIFNKKIAKRIINNKLKNLELRKKTLQDLIKKTQKDYFQYGKMSEGNYNLRTKKFAEFIRDIDRQIPLLKEQLMKIVKKESAKSKLKKNEIPKIKKSRTRKPKPEKIKLRKVKIEKAKTRRRR